MSTDDHPDIIVLHPANTPMSGRLITARHPGWCGTCGAPLEPGQLVRYGGRGRVACGPDGKSPGCVLPLGVTRSRREARAEQLRSAAHRHESLAAAAAAAAEERADGIPLGQPILAGHHSERRDRRWRAGIRVKMTQAGEHSRAAEASRAKAANIEAAASRAVYRDDLDAVDRLAARIAELEAARDRIRAYNQSCRAGARDVSLLDEEQRAELLSIARASAWSLGPNGECPAYVLANLGKRISVDKKRLAGLRAEHEKGAST